MQAGEKLKIESFSEYSFYEPLEVYLHEDDDFLKIIETLTRIGVASKKEKKLTQSCNILHKKGRFYIVHFKELFALSGKCHDLLEEDIQRRNTIAKLLEQWGLLEVANKDILQNCAPSNSVKIIPYKEKKDWILVKKYTMLGEKKKMEQDEKLL